MEKLDIISLKLNNKNNAIIYGDWLDEIRESFKNGKLNNEYFLKEPIFNKNLNKEHKSYFVSVCHYLCNEFNFDISSWIYKSKWILKEPYFSMNAKGMLKLVLLQESPYEFKKNNIFVTKNVLKRI